MHFLESVRFGTVPFVELSLMVWLLIALALAFDFLNGFHDAANSVATVVSTRVLSPYVAVVWAAFFNFIAFLVFQLTVAATMGKGIIDPHIVDNRVIAATLVAACFWDVLTWYWGLPTSSSHALIGGMIGAALANTGWTALEWDGIGKTVLFIVLAPLIGMLTGLAIAVVVLWVFRRSTPRRVDAIFRRGQLVSASFYSLGHGGNDAQKTMGIIFVLLLAAVQANPHLYWVDRFDLTDKSIDVLRKEKDAAKRPRDEVLKRLETLKGRTFARQAEFEAEVKAVLSPADSERYLGPIIAAADQAQVPTEVVLSCHVAMGLGTLFGGWRIVKTMGQRIIKLRPVDGFCAEAGAATTLIMTIFGGIPVSTTHTITGAIVGVGALKRLSAVRWGVAGRVVWAWILTIPGCALVAALCWWLLWWLPR
jgi:PiT family inorganic phosphate transporter